MEWITDEEILQAVRKFWKWCEKADSSQKQTPWPTKDPALRDRFTEEEIEEKMEEMNERNILDYGTSVRGSWIVGEE